MGFALAGVVVLLIAALAAVLRYSDMVVLFCLYVAIALFVLAKVA